MLHQEIISKTPLSQSISSKNKINQTLFNTPSGTFNYEALKNLPSINDVILKGNLTTEDLKIASSSMTEIELSTDIESPTEITDYISKSGTYVAKNLGLLGLEGEPCTILGKGMFFQIINLKEYYSLIGGEMPDDQNVIMIKIPSIDGPYELILIKQGTEDWNMDNVTINSLNINDYVDVDTSRLLDKYNNINSVYGVQMIGTYLGISSASQSDINGGLNTYKPITSNNIAYAVQKKGELYFPKLEDFNTLNTDVTNLKSEIEQILDTVVTVNE